MTGQSGDYEMTYAVYYDDAFFFEDPLLRGIGGLGELLRDGTGVEQDIEKAVMIFEFNAEVLGKGNGYTALGLLYEAETGTYDGIEQSYDTAMSYFLASYQDESLEETDFKGPRYAADLYDSGYTHDDGTWEEPDYVAAEECYLIAAAGNGRTYDSTASYKLGVYYEEGRDGIEQDYEQALYYFELTINNSSVHSTMLGVPRCYLSLANFYENGLGTDADIDTAIYYYQMALAAANDNLALENTGSEDSDMEDVAATATAALEALGAPLEMETENETEE